ncbi:MAG TPA: hypothetical protein VMO47_00045, partial [Rhodothermales bacterium]|nr:hypothetical protein [Rhodothermales bacterium]
MFLKSSRHATILLVVCSVLLLSCSGSPSTTDPPDDEFDRALMLDNFGRAVIIPSYEALQRAVDALETGTTAFAADRTEATLSD